jgi:hypothetical protein
MRSQRGNTVLMGLLVSLLAPSTVLEQVPSKPAADVTPLEYEVFSAYITDAFTGSKGEDRVASHVSNIVIINTTRSDVDDSHMQDENEKPVSWEEVSKYLQKKAPTLQRETIESFRAVRVQSVPLHPSFQLPVPYQLVDMKGIDAIFDNKGWWTDYYKKFPGSQGFLVLSRIGFSADRSQALFYASNSCGGKCGTGTYVVMETAGRGWKLMKEILIWIS